jgi:AraC-like DNA-binding protein
MGALLGSHLCASIEEAPHMTPRQQVLAVDTAADLALAAMQAALSLRVDSGLLGQGLYQAARLLISRDCCDAGLTAERVAAELGCSRAALYRAFAAHGEGVAELIWAERLARAWRLLTSPSHRQMPVADIAFRGGFSDPAAFSRMFKRRYGMTPSNARGD